MSGRGTNAPRAGGALLDRTAAMQQRGCHRALPFPQPPVQGDPTPSVDYVALTERLRQAGTLTGIEVVHVILADTRCCSFKEMGRL